MDLDMDGDTALVTASSSRLGKGSAKALAREGVDVIINGRDEDRLADAKAEIEVEAAGRVITERGDLIEPDDIEALVDTAVTEFGGLDHLVMSAGGALAGPPSSRRPMRTGIRRSTCW